MTRLRVALTNLGCRVNRVELDDMAEGLRARGCVLVGADEADVVIVNTCAVTGEAEAKARKAVRHAAHLAQRPLVVATGCVASLFADELAQLADNVIVEPKKAQVVARVLEAAGQGGGESSCALVEQGPDGCLGGVTPTGRMRPGLKIQDGCDNRCTYCIVWKARGKATSTPADEVVSRVDELVHQGAREVVLTGIDLGRYDYEGADLAKLLRRILDETEVLRLRLSSIEPAGVTDGLLGLMAGSNGRVAPFLHIPLQSGCTDTLERMNRPYTAADYREVVARARRAVPGVAVACDLIVGFPGEDEREFAESLDFCREMGFSKMHVFRYSRRPGTPAAAMDGQVDPQVSAERALLMRELAVESRHAYAASLVGSQLEVLVERPGRGTSGEHIEVLVGEGQPGELVSVTASRLAEGAMLDAR